MTRADKGSIKELSKGRWMIRVSGGNDPETGKRIRLSRTIRGTKRDAIAERTRMLVEVGDISCARSTMTFGSYVDDVFIPKKEEQIRRGEYSPTSFERIKFNLRRHTEPIWDVPLGKVTPFMIEKCIATGGGPCARFSIFSDVRLAWFKAISWGFVPKSNDLFDLVEKPRKPTPEIITADTELLAKILKAVEGTSVEPIVLMMAGCGLRCSEACGLDWEFFDWDEGIVPITRAYHKVGGKGVFTSPKTVASAADVSMPDFVWKRMFELSHDADGNPTATGAISRMGYKGRHARRHPGSASEEYRALYRKHLAGEPYVCIKNLRHSHATILLESGEDIGLVSKRLRHSNLATTYTRYLKPGMSADRHSSGLFGAAMAGALRDPK